jgi:hypothetical protein
MRLTNSRLMRINEAGAEVKIADLSIVTNLDSKYNHWVFPQKFYVLPEIGDYISSNERELKVCRRVFEEDGSITIEVTNYSGQ